jgi:sigma-B regulation protein RsbU (phosphoserine phosphatase)
LRLRTKLLLSTTGLLVATVVAISAFNGVSTTNSMLAQMEQDGEAIAQVLAVSSSFAGRVPRQVENVLAEQMVVEARITSHMIAIAEGRAGMSPPEIKAILKAITETTALDEFWITDSSGRVYLTNTDIDFTFDPDPSRQPQAYIFYRLLGEQNAEVIQHAQKREIDTRLFKYVGVSGIDGPRIVQIGYEAAILDEMSRDVNTQKLVDDLTGQANVAAVRVVDKGKGDIAVSQQPSAGIGAELSDGDFNLLDQAISARDTRATLEGNILRVATPRLDASGEVQELTLVYLTTEAVQAAITGSITRTILIGMAAIVLGILMSYLLSSRITRPIEALNKGAKIVGGGNLDYQLNVKTGDEVEDLAGAFNKMTADLKVHIAQLQETTAARERIESELRVATEIQTSMLPRIFPPFPDRKEFEIFAAMKPAREVGGDFYDFFFVTPNKLCFTIGDVSGKGIPAALFMAISRTLIKTEGMRDIPPDQILSRVNAIMYPDNDASMFLTCFCGIFDTDSGEIRYSNGGHLPPLLYAGGDTFNFVKVPTGLVVGAMPDVRFECRSITLKPGDVFFLYTDGVTEATNPRDELYSETRLQQAASRFRDKGIKDFCTDLGAEIDRFAGGAPQADDITVLALRFKGPISKSPEGCSK